MMIDNFLHSNSFILASKSPRRKQILKMIGLNFQIIPSNYNENQIPNITPQELVRIHSNGKAEYVAENQENNFVIGSDTIVVIHNNILEKPKNRQDAFQMLKTLSNQTHNVITGYTVINSANMKSISNTAITKVTFYPLTYEVINHYLDHSTYIDKAGSYAIQDFSAVFIKIINGCFYNVMGFPISEFYQFVNHNFQKLL